MIDENAIHARYAAIKDRLDERGRRLFVAAEKAAAGYGGTAAVWRATGVARSTIIRGAKDLLAASPGMVRVRRKGAGRPPSSKVNPALLEDLRRLVEPATMCSGAQSKCGGRAIEGQFRRTLGVLAAFGDHAASRNLRSRRSRLARPYIWRLMVLSRLICPSV